MKKLTFESVLRKSIYKNRNAIYDLIPPEGIIGRLKERNDLIMELSPVLLGSPVSSIFVYGTPGTGKTALAIQISRELQKEAKKQKIKLKQIYINCSENRTEYAILYELFTKLSNTEAKKSSTKNIKTQLKKILKEESILVILDEVDYVLRESGDDILYWLSRANQQEMKISSIIISNDLRVYDYLSPRTQSSFGRVKIIFPPYTAEELKEILSSRAKIAFSSKTISDSVLGRIADIEAERGGDARKALELLDACAKLALARGFKSISLELVNNADQYLEQDGLTKTLRGLTKHQKVLYLTLLKQKEITGPELYLNYVKNCKSFKTTALSERRIRSFIILFNDLGLIHSEVGWIPSMKKKARKITLTLDSAIKIKVRKEVRDSI